MKKKIAYISLTLSYHSGINNKIEQFAQVAAEEKIPIDFYWLTKYSDKIKKDEYLNVITKKTGNPFAIRFWQANFVNKLQKKYDKIIIRYPMFDPVFFLKLKNRENIITEHHTKEIEEYKLKGNKRYLLEKWFGSRWLKGFGGIIAVTEEIRKYEIKRSGSKAKSAFIPNSVRIREKSSQLPDTKIGDKNYFRLTMVANFRPWHGLKHIAEGMRKHKHLLNQFTLNLVGEMEDSDKKMMQVFDGVNILGKMDKTELIEIYKNTDIGIASYALYVNELKDATTLKVREYYVNGIPVVFGHSDPAFPDDFRYKYYNPEFNIPEILKFAEEIKGTEKKKIFEAAKPYISSEIMLKKMHDFAVNA